MRKWLLLAVAATFSANVGAQAPTSAAAFEVASVKVNASGDGSRRGIGMPPGGRLMLTDVPLRTVLRFAFDVQDVQIAGGPSWLNTEFFDIEAKAPSDQIGAGGQVPPAALKAMLRGLLADRFKLSTRRETRQLPIYALVVARNDGRLGPRLQPAAVDCDALDRNGQSPAPAKPGAPPPCGGLLQFGHLMLRGWSMTRLATNLSTWAERLVVDRTNLHGGYDLNLEWSPDQRPQFDALGGPARRIEIPADRTGPSLFTALEEQLGLKLEATTGPADVLVIDHVEKPSPD